MSLVEKIDACIERCAEIKSYIAQIELEMSLIPKSGSLYKECREHFSTTMQQQPIPIAKESVETAIYKILKERRVGLTTPVIHRDIKCVSRKELEEILNSMVNRGKLEKTSLGSAHIWTLSAYCIR
jgi:hypothetical protein